ncbi:MAG: helix-turn-helix domain-containing protein [Clostridiaceae bacterium]|nr:helix-turn-helix domain-containing protein [Clostridiaceae bacterium]
MEDFKLNYIALLEVILSPEEVLPDLILDKYGLIELTLKEKQRVEALEMKRLHGEGWTYEELAGKFGLSSSGVCRRVKRLSRV